ncbi:MAG: V-type ATP synthase subunit E family protein [Nitrososphaerales archaeon]
MSKEELKTYIRSKADEEVKKIIGEAENTAKKMIEEAEIKAAQIKDEKLKKIKKEMDEKEKAGISFAKMDGRKKVMDVKEDFLKRALDEVEKRLKGFSSSKTSEKYQEILTDLTVEAVSNIDSKEVKISANKSDLDALRKNLQAIRSIISKKKGEVDIELDNKPIDTIGGVIIYSKDGKQIYNNTFEARLSRTFEESKGKLLTMLFEE